MNETAVQLDPRVTEKDEYYMSLAFAVAKGSKCLRAALRFGGRQGWAHRGDRV